MIPDFHLHSSFSDDSDADIFEMIKFAKSIGMNSFCITDHYDKDYPPDPDGLTFNLPCEEYYTEMCKVKEAVKADFDLKIGIELGVMRSTCDKLTAEADRFKDLDLIIQSSHIVNGCDPYYPEYFEGKDPTVCYRDYFESILYNVTHMKNYDVYGHLDYVLRYGPARENDTDITRYLDIFEAAFKTLIPEGRGIEINTGSLYRGLSYAHPKKELLSLYKELGGEILTIGSDCHDGKHIGYAFKETLEFVKAMGFKYICTYNKRKPEFHKL